MSTAVLDPVKELASQLEVSEMVVKMITPLQQGWLKLAVVRKQTFDTLQAYELEVQALQKAGLESQELEGVQKSLREAKSKAAEAKECRLFFTGMLQDKIIAKSMEFEKRNDEVVKLLVEHEFKLRESANTLAKQNEDVNREKEEFKAHVKNEHYRIAADYRSQLLKLVSDSYVNALSSKFPVKEIEEYKRSIKGFCADVKLSAFKKFSALLIDSKEMMSIYTSIPKYEPAADLEAAIKSVDEKFSMYANDLKNAEAASARVKAEAHEQEIAIQQEVEIEAAQNTLIASAGTLVMSGGPNTAVKRKWEVVDENTQQWALLVMSAFMANMKELIEYVKVKTWEKLSIGQMAAAIAKGKTEKNLNFPNLQFKEVKK